ncbi:MAG: hypothetical protein A2X08_18140 [Bacteroidetes bacterium GWA2_32_17]|nr:MAG: hypothetical protein A2X08_18140 [Bacteroidetes bacterium GWA2_32_17]
MTSASKYNKLIIGLSLGIIAPAITLLIFTFFKSQSTNVVHYLKFVIRMSLMSNVLSLCALPNLAIFYFFINKEYYYSTRGVILATIIWGALVVITRYTT